MKKIKKNPPKIVSDFKELVLTSAEKFGDKTFYEYKVGKETKKYSYNKYLSEMNAYGTALNARGYIGKNIAVIGDTSPYWALTYVTAVNGNSTIVPLDKELSLDAVCDFINLSECAAIAYTGAFNGKITTLAEKIPNVSLFIRLNSDDKEVDSPEGVNVVDINTLIEEGQALLDGGDASYTSITPDTEKCCSILFTSGTTGTSKGVMLSQKNIITSVNAACELVPFDDSASLVSVLPIHHTYEFTCTHLAAMNIGASVYINPSLKYASKSMQYYKPNGLVVVPLFLETVHKKVWAKINDEKIAGKVKAGMKLSNIALKLGIDIRRRIFADVLSAFGGNIETIICGGAPIQPNIIKDFNAFGITVLEGYGITETAPLVSVTPYQAPKIGSVGPAAIGTQVKVDETTLDDSGRGELLVKGGNVMLGYYKNPEATAEVFTEDGWFRTGDIGYIDADGYIYITGRKKNVIILSNGKNVYPEELEENLLSCTYAKEIVVIGRRDEKGSETSIVAVVFPDFESHEDMSSDEVKAKALEQLKALNENMPSFKQVSVFEFRDTEFEKTTTKKIKRFLVK
ncbi:MAG: AMP-binding protein [Clostridia bacterium]|nr:AMP-binding protein [Clostridia bacterium]